MLNRNFFKISIAVAFMTMPLTLQAAPGDKIESIYGVNFSQYGVTFQVASSGCTNKDSFEIVKNTEGDRTELQLVRKSPDICEVFFPFGIEIFYSYSEFELPIGSALQIKNPLKTFIVPDYRIEE